MFRKIIAQISIYLFCYLSLVNSQILDPAGGWIPSDNRVEWTNAGLINHITYADHSIDIVNDPRLTGNYDQRISQAISIASGNSGITIIFFPTGTYVLNETIIVQNGNIVFLGEDPGNTILQFNGGKNKSIFRIEGFRDTSDPIFLSADLDKADKDFTTTDMKGLTPNTWVHLSEYNFQVEDMASFQGVVGQINKIYSINSGTSGTFEYGASKDYLSSKGLRIFPITPVMNVGIENLKIIKSSTGSTGEPNIIIQNAINCWVKGVESYLTNSVHINVYYSAHIEISGCYIHDSHNWDGDGNGYGVRFYRSTTNSLLENNLFYYLRHSIVLSAGANCNVISYNYSRYQYSPWTSDYTDNDFVLHGRYAFSNLVEQNWAKNIKADASHGNNGPYNAFLRNVCYDDEDDEWHRMFFHSAPHTSVIGCWISALNSPCLGGDGNTSFSIDCYGGIGQVYYVTHEYVDEFEARRDHVNYDVSYYYSSRPSFIPSSITFPSIGPPYYSDITETIPARERYNATNKTYIEYPTELIVNRVLPLHKNVNSSSGSTTFTIENQGICDDFQWNATDNANWVTLSPVSGTLTAGQTQVLTVNYDANPTNLDRTCTLTVNYFSQSEQVTLTQYGKPTTSGTLSSNETWRENVTLTGDLTIPSGKTLTITAGQTITLPNYTEIYVSGTLTAQGTENNPIIFQSQSGIPGNSNNTYLIRFNNASSSGSSLEYCELKNAYRGIYLYYSGAALKHSRFEGFYYGIYANRASNTPLIEHNQFTGCSYGIYQYYTYSYSSIKNNTMNCSSYGIYNYRSSPAIYSNEMYGAAFGIRCDSYSSPQMSSYSQPGNNIIHGHFMVGMYVTDNSNPFLGSDYCLMDGHNSFENNEEGQITAIMNSSVVAENNWWGTPTPPASFFTGNVDYIPYLTSPPFMGMSAPPEEIAFDADFGSSVPGDEYPASDIMAYYDEDWNLTQKTRFAHALIYNGEPESAQQICKDIIETCPDSAKAFYALDLLWQASRMEGVEKSCDEEAFITYLNNLTQQKEHKELYGSAELLLAGFEGKDGLSRMDYVFETYRQSYLAEAALFQKFMYYLNDLEDVETAKKISNQLDEFFPESPSALQAQHLLGDEKALGYKSQMAKSPDSYDWSTDHSIPEKYALLGAYPNPFNPSTSIRYHLPKDSKLQIVLYNTLGQVVFKEIIPNQPAGRHAYTWSGRDERNHPFPSGLYIVRFSAEALDGSLEAFEKALKLTLIR